MNDKPGVERMLLWYYRRGIGPAALAYARIRDEAKLSREEADIYTNQCVEYGWLALADSGYWVTHAGRQVLGLR